MAVLVSCHTDCYGGLGVAGAIELLPEAGLSFVELPVRTVAEWERLRLAPTLTPDTSLHQLDRIQRLLDRHGLSVSSCDLAGGNPLDPATVALLKRKLDVASHFGVSRVVGPAGCADDPSRRATLYRHLIELGDHAAGRGITYCFDVLPGLCQHHRLMVETIEGLQHPHLRLNFDPGHLHYYNENIESEVALARICQYVDHVHLRDTSGVSQEWWFPALGSGGAVDFFRIREILETVGFRGPYSLVVLSEPEEGLLPAETYQQRIAESLEHLRQCGYFD